MVKDFGWTAQTAIGQELKGYSENFSPVVIGVVKNFNKPQRLRKITKPNL